ncbi:hypothetical protein HK104_003717 [Borealophlyctis nickersoniae]|nr:hypothetical protein HK104_003717 [Borealophlyctis nickersoniae]
MGPTTPAQNASAAPAPVNPLQTVRGSDGKSVDFSRVVETILQINQQLIRVLVECQNRRVTLPDLISYKVRFQANLTYLATMADYVFKPVQCLIDTGFLNGVVLTTVQ